MKKQSRAKTSTVAAPSNGVCLTFIDPAAQAVSVAGTFNDWHPDATPMISLGNGLWRKELTLVPGRYEYRFVADGRWVPDPATAESAPNPFGETNSVLVVSPAG